MPGVRDVQFSPGWVIGGSIAFMLIAGTIFWFAIPGPQARHHFVSPTGRIALEVGETCGEGGCDRRITAEIVAPDGNRTRSGCALELPQTHAVLLNAHPMWSADEQTVEIVYADSEGEGGKFALDIVRDCPITE